MENKQGNKKHFILTNTFEVILYLLLGMFPVFGILLWNKRGLIYLRIRLGIFLLDLTLWGIFSAIDIFKESKIKAILRIILVLVLVSVIGYISYVAYLTSGR